ncbi:MAG: hypothetical protein ACYC9M_15860 [Desulfobulbaceae bacterium]
MNMENWKRFSHTAMMAGMMLLMATIVGVVASALAGSPISARYLKPRGDHITWKIRVPSPAPAAVLVTQYILPGSDILESSHPLSSYDKEKGIAQWLLSPVSPGVLRMEMKLSKPIPIEGKIHGEVMFHDDSHNTIASIVMEPKPVKKAFEGC